MNLEHGVVTTVVGYHSHVVGNIGVCANDDIKPAKRARCEFGGAKITSAIVTPILQYPESQGTSCNSAGGTHLGELSRWHSQFQFASDFHKYLECHM